MDKKLDNLRLLTLAEAARVLQLSTRTLQRMIQQRELPAFKVGGQWRIRETQLIKWVERKERLPGDSTALETRIRQRGERETNKRG